jgi:SAM-dependent methyltransferase
MDLTDIQYPDGAFDIVMVSHVLEHIPDDRRAMRELRRVTSPGGWALLQVPLRDGPTLEDPSITDPDERVRAFGQADHVRMYGPDIAERLTQGGFRVEVLGPAHLGLGPRAARRRGLAGETAFYCVAG